MALEIIEISPEEIQRFHSLANPENRQTEQDAVVAPPNNASIQNLPLTGGNTARNDGDEIVEPQVDVADGDANDDAHHAGSALNGSVSPKDMGSDSYPPVLQYRDLLPHISANVQLIVSLQQRIIIGGMIFAVIIIILLILQIIITLYLHGVF
eukprot:CAMPEP_0202457444 /NCGR_PEP_ID=MMETSP1360-20130828/14472_1 /ASSEMBLY_ACC=CAM_ASM_000848 /TAXON_ID=515479 /ORGANISM="Licmophora paradoxa, Strain CCMP2313" /LENGTH=152 /DNA_ID=CAMNT_0049077541 /DNA_START=50 /DNA_END=509 /DNA_ORIENTATION=-